MPKKEKTKKPKKVVKQKQKQQISIVINSNNRSKRTTAPKQAPPPPPPQQPPRNNPPVVNVMGDTRPQVSGSGNFSGLGQQSRIFANDSGLEQRLLRLLKMDNDASANPTPALSNAKILAKEMPRHTSPVKMRPFPQKEGMDLDFFNTKRKAYEDNLAMRIAQDAQNEGNDYGDDEEEMEDEETKTPSLMEKAKDKWNSIFSPKPNAMHPPVGATMTPAQNLMNDLDQEDDEDEGRASAVVEIEPNNIMVLAGRKEWMKLKRAHKTDWAYDNKGVGSHMVQLSDDDIDNMRVSQLNALYDQVMQARSQRK